MLTRHYIAVALATLALVSFVFAKAMRVPLQKRCKDSDFIAVVEITQIERGGASKPYLKIATARVIESIKGRVDAASFRLDFDNGLTCPNITYERGDRRLVFLTKLRTGHFATYNTYYGAYAVSNDIVRNWEFEMDTRLDVVRKEIRNHVD